MCSGFSKRVAPGTSSGAADHDQHAGGRRCAAHLVLQAAGKLHRVAGFQSDDTVGKPHRDLSRDDIEQFLAAMVGAHVVDKLLGRKEHEALEAVTPAAGREGFHPVAARPAVPDLSFPERGAGDMDGTFVDAFAEELRHRDLERVRDLQHGRDRRHLQAALDLGEIAFVQPDLGGEFSQCEAARGARRLDLTGEGGAAAGPSQGRKLVQHRSVGRNPSRLRESLVLPLRHKWSAARCRVKHAARPSSSSALARLMQVTSRETRVLPNLNVAGPASHKAWATCCLKVNLVSAGSGEGRPARPHQE